MSQDWQSCRGQSANAGSAALELHTIQLCADWAVSKLSALLSPVANVFASAGLAHVCSSADEAIVGRAHSSSTLPSPPAPITDPSRCLYSFCISAQRCIQQICHASSTAACSCPSLQPPCWLPITRADEVCAFYSFCKAQRRVTVILAAQEQKPLNVGSISPCP